MKHTSLHHLFGASVLGDVFFRDMSTSTWSTKLYHLERIDGEPLPLVLVYHGPNHLIHLLGVAIAARHRSFHYMGVSENSGVSPQIIHLFIGFSIIINHPFWGVYPYVWKYPYSAVVLKKHKTLPRVTPSLNIFGRICTWKNPQRTVGSVLEKPTTDLLS